MKQDSSVAPSLICYQTSKWPIKIVAAPLRRTWMDDTGDFAYRCLPLSVANSHGWMVLNPATFVAEWKGGADLGSLAIESLDRERPLVGCSHFGHGILTFLVDGLFRTDADHDLYVTGPTNFLKDGIQPLTGVVETDWAQSTFTMNWRFTRSLHPIFFFRDEPICTIFPIKRGLLEDISPKLCDIKENRDLEKDFKLWQESRLRFNRDLNVPGSAARMLKWQKDYLRGKIHTREAPPTHRTRLRLRDFE